MFKEHFKGLFKRHFKWLLLPLCFSCHRHHPPPIELQRSAYAPQMLSEKGRSDILIEVVEKEPQDWQRQPFESVEEWLERLQEKLTLNDQLVENLKNSFSELSLRETETAQTIQDLIYQNQQMDRLEEIKDEAIENQEKVLPPFKIAKPPFSLYLVKPTDTLYSIAMQTYQSKEAIKDILIWNQGWIRHPNELTAGLCLILFNKDAKDKSLQAVERYFVELDNSIKQLQR